MGGKKDAPGPRIKHKAKSQLKLKESSELQYDQDKHDTYKDKHDTTAMFGDAAGDGGDGGDGELDLTEEDILKGFK